jgi:hypothetical protein
MENVMRIFRIVALVLVVVHMILVVCGAFNVRRSKFEGSSGPALNWYAKMSGADHCYGFFSPNISPAFRLRFILSDKTGRTWTDTLEEGANPEARVRLGNAPYLFSLPDLGDQAMSSLAATMFARHPEANRVVICVEGQNPPTMQQYRAGHLPTWQPLGEFAFSRAE